jgi:hypothetical protein
MRTDQQRHHKPAEQADPRLLDTEREKYASRTA